MDRTHDEEAQYKKVVVKAEKFSANSYVSEGIGSSAAGNIRGSKGNARTSNRHSSQSSSLEHDTAVILIEDSLSISNGDHPPRFIEGTVSSSSKEDVAKIYGSSKIDRTDTDVRKTIGTVNELPSLRTILTSAKKIKKKRSLSSKNGNAKHKHVNKPGDTDETVGKKDGEESATLAKGATKTDGADESESGSGSVGKKDGEESATSTKGATKKIGRAHV